jgi:predicted O-methyltransferase YrrM
MALPSPQNEWQYRDGDQILPWYTLPFLRELVTWDLSGKRVLEWGSGHSTLWWARHAAHVVSVDSDYGWTQSVCTEVDPARCEVILGGSLQDYLAPALSHGPFDIIIVDGEYRIECLSRAFSVVNLGGIVILDNVEFAPESTYQPYAFCERHCYPQPNHAAWLTDYWRVHARTPCALSPVDARAQQIARRQGGESDRVR